MPPWAWPTRLQGLHPAGAALPQGGLLPQCAPCSLPTCSGTCTLSLAPQQDPLAFPGSPGHLGRGRATSPCLHFTLRANETPLPGNGLLRVVFVTAPALAHGITDSCWTLERERLLGVLQLAVSPSVHRTLPRAGGLLLAGDPITSITEFYGQEQERPSLTTRSTPMPRVKCWTRKVL